MISELELRFDSAMMLIYTRARSEAKYTATRYLQMLNDNRGIATAQSLIRATTPSEGFTALWERKRLDLTVEALVLQHGWAPLFEEEPDLLVLARKRLAIYEYDPK